MKQEQIAQLLKNAEFAGKLNKAKTVEEILSLFAEYGCEMTREEFETYFHKGNGALSEDELAAVTGGENGLITGIECLLVGFGISEHMAACAVWGIGFCFYWGYGAQ